MGAGSSLEGLSLGPRSAERPADAGVTLVGVLDTTAPAGVDGGGLVQLDGADWSIDWWIGADDRWHLPAREPAVRQRRLGAGPVLETAVRIPSGDAVQRVYGVNVGGHDAIVIEIENNSPIPVALGIAIRPYDLAGRPGHPVISLDDDVVEIADSAVLTLPRRPNEVGASTGDVLESILAGQPLAADASGPATVAALYPLPHRTSLRFLLSDQPIAGGAVPGADNVSRGWSNVLDRNGRFEFPDPAITTLADAARCRLLLAAATLPRRVGRLEPGTGRILEGLALSGAVAEILGALGAIAGSFPSSLPSSACEAASIVSGVGRAARLADDQPMAEELLEPVAQLTHLIEKGGEWAATREAFIGLARLLFAAGQPDPARELWDRAGGQGRCRDVPSDVRSLTALGQAASPTGSWDHDDAVLAARYWLGARALLIDDRPDHLDLLPTFPPAWRGGNLEVHGAATSHGLASFAIRWHGYRPALLWEVDADGPVEIRCPGLDPHWSTTDLKGETLLAASADDLPPVPAAGESFQ